MELSGASNNCARYSIQKERTKMRRVSWKKATHDILGKVFNHVSKFKPDLIGEPSLIGETTEVDEDGFALSSFSLSSRAASSARHSASK